MTNKVEGHIKESADGLRRKRNAKEQATRMREAQQSVAREAAALRQERKEEIEDE